MRLLAIPRSWSHGVLQALRCEVHAAGHSHQNHMCCPMTPEPVVCKSEFNVNDNEPAAVLQKVDCLKYVDSHTCVQFWVVQAPCN